MGYADPSPAFRHAVQTLGIDEAMRLRDEGAFSGAVLPGRPDLAALLDRISAVERALGLPQVGRPDYGAESLYRALHERSTRYDGRADELDIRMNRLAELPASRGRSLRALASALRCIATAVVNGAEDVGAVRGARCAIGLAEAA